MINTKISGLMLTYSYFLNIVSIPFLSDNELTFLPIFRVQLDRYFIKGRSRKGIFRYTWTIWVKAHHTEHRPCRHGSRVIISWYAIRLCTKLVIKMPLIGKAFLFIILIYLIIQIKSADVQPFIYFQF